MDEGIDSGQPNDVAWVCANNIDPLRDCFLEEIEDHHTYHGLFIDGTAKTNEFDQFGRDWPNIILMDDKIIKKIDERWNSLSLGPFLPSPSIRYNSLVLNAGAIASTKE